MPVGEFELASWTVYPDRNLLARDSEARHLEPRAMDLLVYFAEHGGEVLGIDQIIRDVWPHSYVTTSAVQTAVSALRKAFDDNPRKPQVFETIPKRGYRLLVKSTIARPVIAVLPIANLSGSADNDFLADGITETLIAELGQHRSLRVVSRQSITRFRGSDEAMPDIARALGTRYVVEGSLLFSGDAHRITLQLIDAAEDAHLWSQHFEPQLHDLLTAQREIARELASHVPGGTTGDETARRPKADIDAEAQIAYLRGRHHWYQLSPDHLVRALEYFEQAVRIDPTFAAAHAGIADVYGAFGYWGLRPAHEVGGNIHDAVTLALKHDENNPEAQMLAGSYAFYYGHDWAAAEAHFLRAIELNPSLSHARLSYALFLATLGRSSATATADLGTQLDPLNPVSLVARALCLAREGHYERVLADIEQIYDLAPGMPPAAELEVEVHHLLGRADALSLERQRWLGDDDMLAALGGNDDNADTNDAFVAAARLLAERSRSSNVAPRIIARLYSLGGNLEAALDIIATALDKDDYLTIDLLHMSPAFAALREHPRFPKIRQAIGLPAT